MKNNLFLLAALTLGLISQNLLAQEDNLHRMYHIKLKTGHATAFYEDLNGHSEWRREQGDAWTWWVHAVVNGENHGDCIIRSGPLTWADLDTYEAFDAKASNKFWEDLGEHIEDATSWISMGDKRFVRQHPQMEKVQLIQVVKYDLKPGMSKQFTDTVQTYHEAIMEHDYPIYYTFDWLINGGTGNQVTLALFHENWADMAPPEEKMMEFMARVLGEEEAKTLGETLNSSFTSTETAVVRYLPGPSIVHEKK